MSASAGRVLLMPQGDYDNTATYYVLDWVRYNEKAYVCKKTSTGHLPTDTTYWQLLVQDGASPNTKVSYEDNGKLGAKNLLRPEVETQTLEGIDYTINADGTILADGTSSANGSYLQLCSLTIPAGTYIKTGCPVGGSVSTYHFTGANSGDDTGSGATVTLVADTVCNFVIAIEPNVTVSNVLFSPMFRLGTDSDATYRPAALTNRELTLAIDGFQGQIDSLDSDLDDAKDDISDIQGDISTINGSIGDINDDIDDINDDIGDINTAITALGTDKADKTSIIQWVDGSVSNAASVTIPNSGTDPRITSTTKVVVILADDGTDVPVRYSSVSVTTGMIDITFPDVVTADISVGISNV